MDRTTAIPRRSSLNPPKSFPSISRTLCNSSREPTGTYVSVRKVPHSRACSTIFSFFERHTPDTSCFECPAAKRLRVSRRKASNHLPPPPKECSRVHTQKPAVPHLNQQYIAAALRSPMAIARTECTFNTHTHLLLVPPPPLLPRPLLLLLLLQDRVAAVSSPCVPAEGIGRPSWLQPMPTFWLLQGCLLAASRTAPPEPGCNQGREG